MPKSFICPKAETNTYASYHFLIGADEKHLKSDEAPDSVSKKIISMEGFERLVLKYVLIRHCHFTT